MNRESRWFDGDVGPSGIDLAGYRIDRIGVRVDALTLDSPGSDPNRDGVWTDYALTGTFLFEGHVASKKACKNGGWQYLRGPDGNTFGDEAACIHARKKVR